jgi:hypothetical protein
MVVGEGKVMLGIEPAMIGAAEAVEGPKFDHRMPPVLVVLDLM